MSLPCIYETTPKQISTDHLSKEPAPARKIGGARLNKAPASPQQKSRASPNKNYFCFDTITCPLEQKGPPSSKKYTARHKQKARARFYKNLHLQENTRALLYFPEESIQLSTRCQLLKHGLVTRDPRLA